MQQFRFLHGFVVLMHLATCIASSRDEQDFSRALAKVRSMSHSPALVTSVVPWNNDLIWNRDKTHVLVVTWLNDATEDSWLTRVGGSRTIVDPVWVCLVPELENFCAKISGKEQIGQLKARLTRWFGRPPQENMSDIVVEMWVRPKDLLRPALSPDITALASPLIPDDLLSAYKTDHNGKGRLTQLCDFLVQQGTLISTDHQSWLNEQCTQLMTTQTPLLWSPYGYGFDWQNAQNPVKGVNYVLVRPSPTQVSEQRVSVIVRSVYHLDEYWRSFESLNQDAARRLQAISVVESTAGAVQFGHDLARNALLTSDQLRLAKILLDRILTSAWFDTAAAWLDARDGLFDIARSIKQVLHAIAAQTNYDDQRGLAGMQQSCVVAHRRLVEKMLQAANKFTIDDEKGIKIPSLDAATREKLAAWIDSQKDFFETNPYVS